MVDHTMGLLLSALLVLLAVLLGACGDGAPVAHPDAAISGDAREIEECEADRVAPNHSPSTALVLEAMPQEIEDLRVCAGRDDWYRLELPLGFDMQFEVCSARSASTAKLEFYRAEYAEPAWYHGGLTRSESEDCWHTGVWQGAGTYFFRVYTTEDVTAYRARVSFTELTSDRCAYPDGEACHATATCFGGMCQCNADALEPNDDPTNARGIELGQAYDLISCVSDDDWFFVEAPSAGELRVSVEANAHLGPGYRMNLAVFAPSDLDEEIAFLPKVNAVEDLTVALPSPGRYLIRVRNVHMSGIAYMLSVSFLR
jgi:hypothetical protein